MFNERFQPYVDPFRNAFSGRAVRRLHGCEVGGQNEFAFDQGEGEREDHHPCDVPRKRGRVAALDQHRTEYRDRC